MEVITIAMQQGFSKFYISALCLLLLFCSACHRRSNPPPILPVVEAPDEDSVFVINELLKLKGPNEYRVKYLKQQLQSFKLRFKTVESPLPVTTKSGLQIITISTPPVAFDASRANDIFFLLKRKNNWALVPLAYLEEKDLIATNGITLPQNVARMCADDNDRCTMLLFETHLRMRIDNCFESNKGVPAIGYNLRLKDVNPIHDSTTLNTFIRLLNDTSLIPVPLPEARDFMEANQFYRVPDSISPFTQALQAINSYNKTIAEKGPCILKVLTNYRHETKRTALKEVKQHYQDIGVYYFYTVPELAVYKVWYLSGNDKIKTAHIRLVTPYRLWEYFYYPEFYYLRIPGCKDI